MQGTQVVQTIDVPRRLISMSTNGIALGSFHAHLVVRIRQAMDKHVIATRCSKRQLEAGAASLVAEPFRVDGGSVPATATATERPPGPA